MIGEITSGSSILETTTPHFTRTVKADNRRADQSADQRVRRTAGQARTPGDQVPDDGAE
jgi:hypothetical protein